MKKVEKILKEYLFLKNNFSIKIANNKLLEKFIVRLTNYRYFEKIVTDFYNKKHADILKFLEINLSDFLSSYIYNNRDIYENEKRTKIFSLWLQGYELAPELVKRTIDSQKDYASEFGYEYILLDQTNLYEYVKLPNHIVKKYQEKKIDFIKYSDIIRTVLLSSYGGIWLDATIYIDSEEKLSYLDKNFYTIRASGKEKYPKYITNGRWALFCLSEKKDGVVCDFLKKIQFEYFKKYDAPIDYFLIDYLMELGYRTSSHVRKEIDSVIDNNKNLYYLVDNFSNTYNVEEWKEILEDTRIFKCSYRVSVDNKKNSFYHMLLERRL